MTEQPMDEQTITDYLLGTLPETEKERLDEMSLTDDDFAEQLRAIENDLVDAYVRGELSGITLTRFKSQYLASPARREKVKFAQTFAKLVDKSENALVHQPTKVADKPRWFSFNNPQWGLAAAVIVMLLAGGYLFFQNKNLRDQMAQIKSEYAALEKREQELLRQRRSSDTEKEKELILVREKLVQLEKQLAAGRQRDVKLVAYNLSPQTRGIGQVPALSVPADTDYVDITLKLETNDFSSYTVILKNPATDKVLWSDKLKADHGMKIRLPASLLRMQNYVLELSGISATGAVEIIGGYPFRVVTQ